MEKLRPPLIEPLEPRLLLSADLPLPAVDAVAAVLPGPAGEAAASHPATAPAVPFAQQAARRELVFVDAAVGDYETLVADLRERANVSGVLDVRILRADRDGIEQISEALRGYGARGERLDAVHVVSHGTAAALRVGDSWLDHGSLEAHAGALSGWRAALTDDADLLLYGCNLAGSAGGQDLIASLALLTGADVAASTDVTGAALLGGNWELEYATGGIESGIAVSAGARAGWAGVLDGTAIASVDGAPTPIASEYDAGAFGAPAPTANVGGPWEVIAGAEAPTRDEKIVIGLDSSGNLSGQIWNGSSWSAFAFNDFATSLQHDSWSFDVAYETASGDALLVYANGSNGNQSLSYRTWNGTAWSGPSTITTPVAGKPERVRLAANPGMDEMVLVATVNNRLDYVMVWDGSGWGNSLVLPGGSSSKDVTDVSVAYEQQSGHAMVVYGTGGPLGSLLSGLLGGTTVGTAIWDGSSWTTGAVSAPGGVSGEARWTSLASDPNSDRLVLGVLTDNRYVWLSVWNGSSWTSTTTATSNASDNNRLGVAVAFESQSGDALATYAVDDDFLHYRTFRSSSGWSADLLGPDLGEKPKAMTLAPDPGSDRVMLSVLLNDERVVFLPWSGAAWEAPGLVVPDSGINKDQPFLFLWDQDSVNHAPVLSPSAPALPAISEDDVTNPGVLVGTLLGASVTDSDAGALSGIAITGLASGNGTWQYSLDGGSSWSPVAPVTPGAALLLRDTDKVRFLPDGRNGTTASFTFRAWDRTSGIAGGTADASVGGGTRAFSVASDTASIVVSSVNDAPALDASGSMTLANVVENDADPPGTSVAAILLSAGGDRVTDVDTGADEGIAVVGVDDTNGTWQYSTDGGGVWTPFGAVSPAAAVLLDADDRIRFVPAPAYGGNAGNLTFHAWDRTSGVSGQTGVDVSLRGGTTAFSSASETATLEVIPVNDAPDLAPAAPVLMPITEDDLANGGQTVASILGATLTDLDPGAQAGIAITGLASGRGTWQFSTDGGGSWAAVGPVSDAEALLLRDSDRIRFVPDGRNADAASFTYRGWDRTSGSAGTRTDVTDNGGTTAFSSQSDTASIAVSAVNDAPVLDGSGALRLDDVGEDDADPAGTSVAAILASAGGGHIGDVDIGASTGIAVIGVNDTNGRWEYSTDGGGSWTPFGGVSNTGAVLLDDAARIRFVPAPGYAGPAGALVFRAWDQTSGGNGQSGVDVSVNGGTTAFSLSTASASLDVLPANDAPVLAPSAPSLPTITEDDMAGSVASVSALLGGSVSDSDAGDASGMAITAYTSGNGSWEYSTDGGGSWQPMGPVSTSSALLLRSSDLVRFLPDGMNATSGTLTYRAWDQTSGAAEDRVDVTAAGGASAFSVASDTALVSVTAVNDAPQAAGAILAARVSDPSGLDLATLFAGSFSDVDAGALFGGVAVVANPDLSASEGSWQYSSDGGATWFAIGAVGDDATALVLDPTARLRFVPAPGFAGTPAALALRALDDSYAGGFSSAPGGLETRATFDAGMNGGSTPVAAGTTGLSGPVVARAIAPPAPLDIRTLVIPAEAPAAEEAAETPTEAAEPAPDAPLDLSAEVLETPVALASDERVEAVRLATVLSQARSGGAGDEPAPAAEPAPVRRIEAEPRTGGAFTALRKLLPRHLDELGAGSAFAEVLDRIERETREDAVLDPVAIGSSLAVTAGISVGYVIWLTRGGLLLASLTSSMPVWRLIDPIPVLASLSARSGDDGEDDESLDSLVRGSGPSGQPPGGAPEKPDPQERRGA